MSNTGPLVPKPFEFMDSLWRCNDPIASLGPNVEVLSVFADGVSSREALLVPKGDPERDGDRVTFRRLRWGSGEPIGTITLSADNELVRRGDVMRVLAPLQRIADDLARGINDPDDL